MSFHVNCFSSSFKIFSIQKDVFSVFPIFKGYYALPCHEFKADILEEETSLKIAKSITRSYIIMVNENQRSKICYYQYVGLFHETIFRV